jgi:dihydroorotase-like cyclic amidohydrolase
MVWTPDPRRMASKSRNTPLVSREIVGKVLLTVAGGRIVHETRAKDQ